MATRGIIAAALLVAASPRASAADAGPAWRLVGGASRPTLVQSLGGGRALLCNERRCDVWDHATGTWTPTDAVVLPINTLSTLRRRDGAVVAIDGARKIARNPGRKPTAIAGGRFQFVTVVSSRWPDSSRCICVSRELPGCRAPTAAVTSATRPTSGRHDTGA